MVKIQNNFKFLGEDHPFYCSAINNKAFILKTCGEYSEAEPLFEEVVKKYTNIYGESSEKVIITQQNLATLYRDSKQTEKAVDLFEKIIENIDKNKLEIKPNVLGNIYNSAAGCYRVIKQFKESDEMRNKAFKIIKDNFGEKKSSCCNYIWKYRIFI